MRFNPLRRREFITLLVGAAAAWPRQLAAQPAGRIYRIGVLFPFPASVLAAWFDELRRLGLVEGQNLAVDRRGFVSSYEQFPTIAAELVKTGLDAMICGGDMAIRAAQAATATIPIVAATDDMVGAGLAESLARPGGNTTGISLSRASLTASGKTSVRSVAGRPPYGDPCRLPDHWRPSASAYSRRRTRARRRTFDLRSPAERGDDIRRRSRQSFRCRGP